MIKYVAEYDRKPYLDDARFFKMLENTVNTGIHKKKPMGLAYFHTSKELKEESLMGLSTHFLSISRKNCLRYATE